MESFFIKTLGCKVNQCDSQYVREKLISQGMREISERDEADLIIVNTCCVTSGADRKSRNAVRAAVNNKSKGHVVVIGCYAGYDRAVIEQLGGVEAVFDNSQRNDFLRWLENRKFSLSGRRDDPVDMQTISKKAFLGRTRAFLKVQDGCDNRCSYCIIPYVRGPSRSRPIEEITEEANMRSEEGFKEIVLTGVCLGSFGKDFDKKVDLIDIVDKIEKVPGIERIRLSSIEASDVTDKLLERMGQTSKLCPHLHIPFQSGDDEVLASMYKKLRVADYQKIINKARKMIKNLAITCDFIAGFPLEKEKNFRNTLEFIKFVKPARVHFFPYSRRKGTVQYSQLIASKVVKDRMIEMRKLSGKLAKAYCKDFIGKKIDVLFEKRTGAGWQGYSQNYIQVFVETDELLGNALRQVKIRGLEDGLAKGGLV